MAALYQAWGKWQNEILLTYQNQGVSLPPLSQQKVFKSIMNMVITEAMQLAGQNFVFEDETMTETTEEPPMTDASETRKGGQQQSQVQAARERSSIPRRPPLRTD